MLVFVVLFFTTVTLFFGYHFAYEPIKFSYLIHRVESAKTLSEEQSALMLAKRWGRVWEIHLQEPPKDWLDYSQLDAVVADSNRTLGVEIEWLESWPNGAPYQARRTLTSKTNIYLLFSKD